MPIASHKLRPMPDAIPADIIAALPFPAILVDAAGTIAAINAPALTAFPAARALDPLTFAVRDPAMLDALRQARRGEPSRFIHLEHVPVERAFDVRAAPAGSGLVLFVLEDMTERRKIERLRVDFIANASHELRTPLSSVLGFIETLRGPARNDSAAFEKFLGIMEEQARRMARLVDDLLSLSRIELQAHVPPTDAVPLDDAARQIVDGMAQRARANGVQLILDAPDGPVTVRGDLDELLRAFENLIENAVRYGASGGRVEIVVGRSIDGRAYATVRDHGPGIPPEHLPRLTERFYRADAAQSRQTGGTGLGLAIVKHIMLRHRGKLDIESTPGEGSAFTMRLDRID
jgi:two-component system, OmpR family, phosphate regulon sensor histidine kinase PhoR